MPRSCHRPPTAHRRRHTGGGPRTMRRGQCTVDNAPWTMHRRGRGVGALAWAVGRGSWWGRGGGGVRWGAGVGLGECPAGGLLEVVVVAADGADVRFTKVIGAADQAEGAAP